jgi:lipopolysaccharide/colanic/teichoic acid biosynthesis glycosyltransferase
MPRWIEVALAATGLLLLSPLLLAIALGVKLTSRGPVLFRQERVGRGGVLFRILKFRTMVADAEDRGLRITCGGRDPRVTAFGYWLRRFKLDELPQLWNVLVGDMKFVGPRPEVPEYVRLWDEVQRAALLAVPPGITDPAAIAFRDEEEMLGSHHDPERTYVEDVMPRKLALTCEYLASRNSMRDVGIIAQTLRRAVLRV